VPADGYVTAKFRLTRSSIGEGQSGDPEYGPTTSVTVTAVSLRNLRCHQWDD
jgi:hypothetical protein